MPSRSLTALPVVPSHVHLAEHRRHMAMKGQMHLEHLAASVAGRTFEPLPKKKRGQRD